MPQTYYHYVDGTGTTQHTTDKSVMEAAIAAWYAAQAAYKAAAEASLASALSAANALAHDWQSNGVTSSGMSAPATPATTVIPQDSAYFCGAGEFRAIGPGPQSSMFLYRKYFGKRIHTVVTTEYRWVQDTAPVPAGSYVFFATSYSGSGGAADINTIYAKHQAAYAGMGSYATFAEYQAAGAAANAGITGFGNWAPDINFYGPSSYQLAWREYGAFKLYMYPNYTISAGVTGQWHQETRVTVSNTTETSPTYCSDASFTFKTDDNPITPLDPDAVIARFRIITLNAVARDGKTASLLNWCGSTDLTRTVADILDDSLTQEDVEGYVIEGDYHPAVEFSTTYPGATFLLQTGSVTQGYNLLAGAFVFDLQLKKWGKYKHSYNCLVEYNPINLGGSQLLTHTDLGMTAGIFQSNQLKIFDDAPTEGYLKWGKIGSYRLGMVHFLETRLDFRRRATGTLTIDSSLDGVFVSTPVQFVESFSNVHTFRSYPNINYKWYTMKLEGQWDLQYMEVRTTHKARR